MSEKMIPGERDINDSAALLLVILGLCFVP